MAEAAAGVAGSVAAAMARGAKVLRAGMLVERDHRIVIGNVKHAMGIRPTLWLQQRKSTPLRAGSRRSPLGWAYGAAGTLS
jgi:hypothetical protein